MVIRFSHRGATMPDTMFRELRSARLLLRGLWSSDLPALCAYRSMPEASRYQSWEAFTPADGERLLAKVASHPGAPGTWFQLAILLDAVMIGDCELHCREDDPRQVEIGITLSPAHHGKGYASEAQGRLLASPIGDVRAERVP
jgi:RimJ/RimL family protein N-acetyltransferase